jgi:cytidylate kinase
MIVAIDGPAASGKSTVARAIAGHLGMAYLDTGAMYRALAVEALRRGVPLDDAVALAELACESVIRFSHNDGSGLPTHVEIDGADVTRAIRTPEADRAVSPVSAVPGVRAAMVDQQRRISQEQRDTVLEGRDIGSVVFPHADLKIFLTASAHERARRRTIDMERRGAGMTYDEVLTDLRRRDEYDSSRSASPLIKAEDAIELDTTGMTIAEVVTFVEDLVARRR